MLRQGDDVALIGYGSMVYHAMQTAEILSEHGVEATVINARFAKPLDTDLMLPIIEKIGRVATLEDGCLMGGFGSALAEELFDRKLTPDLLRLGVPDKLVDHASPDQSKAELGLMPSQMAERILKEFELSEAQRKLAEQV